MGTRRELDALADAGLGRDGYYGPVGEFDRLISPISEASRVGMALQVLTMFGNLLGRRAFIRIGPTKHYGNLFVVTVGRTAMARKGYATAEVNRVFDLVDPNRPILRSGGLATGQGIISHLRDANPEKDDPGAAEKRLLTIEQEFRGVLTRCDEKGSILSPTIRKAWDGDPLQNLTMNSPMRASGHTVSVIGHITQEELLGALSTVDQANGFANRFMFVWVARAAVIAMPQQPDPTRLQKLADRIKDALDWVNGLRQIEVEFYLDANVHVEYEMAYTRLTRERSSMIGMLTSRRAAQVLRMALIYAALDQSQAIRFEHFHAARAVWDYVEKSTELIFDDTTGNRLADQIRGLLRESGSEGLTRTEIIHRLGNNIDKGKLDDALDLLESEEIAHREKQRGGKGRPPERWVIAAGQAAQSEERIIESNGVLQPDA